MVMALTLDDSDIVRVSIGLTFCDPFTQIYWQRVHNVIGDSTTFSIVACPRDAGRLLSDYLLLRGEKA